MVIADGSSDIPGSSVCRDRRAATHGFFKGKQMGKIKCSREIPVRRDVDVFVAGGGPAGVAAAVTAARAGAETFIIDGGSSFGGMGALGLVPAFMPLGDGERLLTGKIGEEVVRRMLSPDGTYIEDMPLDTRCEYSINAEKLKKSL